RDDVPDVGVEPLAGLPRLPQKLGRSARRSGTSAAGKNAHDAWLLLSRRFFEGKPRRYSRGWGWTRGMSRRSGRPALRPAARAGARDASVTSSGAAVQTTGAPWSYLGPEAVA